MVIDSNDDMGTAKRIKIAIVTAMWRRPDVFRMFAEGVKVLQRHFDNVEIICCVAGSEMNKSKDLAQEYGFQYCEAHNRPLYAKIQKAVSLAKNSKADYCLMVGSDDIITQDLMQKYISLAHQKVDYACLMDCYFYDTRSKRAMYWGGYISERNKGRSAGIGRFISSVLLEKIGWQCWPPGYDNVLDTGFDKQLEGKEFTKYEINLKKENLFALDIKSGTNMTPFAKWDNTEYVNAEEMLFNNLPEPLAERIYGSTRNIRVIEE